MGEAFDVLGEGDELLEVGILAVGVNGVVDYDAMDGGILVRGQDGVFDS